MARSVTVAAVDDDRMLLEGLRAWLARTRDIHLEATASSVDELLARKPAAATVVLLDLVLADRSDPVANVLHLVDRGYRVLVVSVVARTDEVIKVVQAGASGYLTKDHDLTALVAAIREVAGGGVAYSPELTFAWARDKRPDRPRLSAQEQAVLLAYASGMTLEAAARHVGIRPTTAKKYLDRVKEKYRRAGRRTYTKLDLADRVREDGLLREPFV